MRNLLPILGLAQAACGGPGVDSVAVRDSLQLVHEVTIGGAEEGPRSFSEIRMLGVDRTGRLYVLEAKEHEVRLFDSTGRFIRRIGGWGEGPAEFQNPDGVAIDASDRLWVYNSRFNRVALFDTSGSLIETRQHQPGSTRWYWVGGIDSSDRFINAELVRTGTSYVEKLIRADLVSGVTDTLDWPDCGAADAPYFQFPRGTMQLPFAGGKVQFVDGRGSVWCGDAGALRIAQYLLGDSLPVRVLAAPATAVPVSAVERDSAIASAEAFKRRAGPADLDYSLIPSHKPIIETLAMDERGRVWVRALTTDGLLLIGFGEDGSLLGSAPFPREPNRWTPMVVRNDRLHFVVLDSNDVPSVEVFRIVARTLR